MSGDGGRAGSSLTEGNILSCINRLALPMLGGAVLQNIQSLIDLFWVGSLGSTAVAAVAMGGTLLMALFPLLMGISAGTLALVARSTGECDRELASRAGGQSIILALIMGGISGALGWLAAAPLLRLLGAAPPVVAEGVHYLRVVLAGSFTAFVLFAASAALQGAGDAVSPMLFMVTANIFNIVLDPLFIFGLGPIPAMGVRGAALATVLSQAVAAAVAMYSMFGKRTRLHLEWEHFRPDPALCVRILKIGIPGSGQMLSRNLMNMVMMRIVAACGTLAVAAYGTGFRIHMIILMPAFALGGAAATMVGQNLGAGKPDRARSAAWLAVGADLVIMAVFAAVLYFFAPSIIGIFNDDNDVIHIGARYLRIVSPFYLFAALGIVLSRSLQGAGDTMGPMVLTIVSLWGLQIPLAMLFARIWQPATQGIWWAVSAAMVLHGLLIAAWFETGRWKKKKV